MQRFASRSSSILRNRIPLLEEIRRVLRPDGLLVISTPNRIYYTEERKEINPFHVREFNFDEFLAFLKRSFAHVEWHSRIMWLRCMSEIPASRGRSDVRWKTRRSIWSVLHIISLPFVQILLWVPGVVIRWSIFPPAPTCCGIEINTSGLRMSGSRYSTDGCWSNKKSTMQQSQWCLQLNQQMQERTEWAQRLEERIHELDARIEELQKQHRGFEKELQLRTEWAERLNQEVAGQRPTARKLQAEFDERTAWALRLNEELKVNQDKLERIKQSKLFQISRDVGSGAERYDRQPATDWCDRQTRCRKEGQVLLLGAGQADGMIHVQ